MSRNGSGVYNLPSGNPVVSGTTITTTWANTTLNDIAASLTGSVAADGQTPMTGALNMGSNKVTSVTDPTNAQDAATKNYTDSAITTATSGLGATYLAKANNLSDVASASTSRTNLGLGTIATQAANSVAVTGGAIDGTTIGSTTRSTVKANTLDLGLSTQSVAIGQGNASIMKNRIINGAMVIDQRNAGALVNPAVNGSYYLDRWTVASTSASKFSIGQNAGSVTPPTGFINYLGITSLAATSLGATDQYFLQQNIEGLNCTDLAWGTANAKTVTLSFQVYSSLTGTFGGALLNSAQNRSYPFSYSIPVANTWTTISINIAGDTTGTWLTTNGTGIRVTFGLGVGSTYSGTAGSWAGSLYYSATGAVSVVGTSGATFYITGVQLEVGSSATGYEYVNYQTSLANCQRYYQTVVRLDGFASGITISSSQAQFPVSFIFPMRSTPSVTLAPAGTSAGTICALSTTSSYPSVVGTNSTVNLTNGGFLLNCTGYTAGGWTSGACVLMYSTSSTTNVWKADAEL